MGGILHGTVSRIRQDGLLGSPTILESDQTLLIGIGASEIQPTKASRLGLLDDVPEEQMHAAKIVEACMAAAIFVRERVFAANRDDGGDDPFVLQCNVDL